MTTEYTTTIAMYNGNWLYYRFKKKGLLYYFVSFLNSLYGMVNSTAHICIHAHDK